jgi:hypothetical protein
MRYPANGRCNLGSNHVGADCGGRHGVRSTDTDHVACCKSEHATLAPDATLATIEPCHYRSVRHYAVQPVFPELSGFALEIDSRRPWLENLADLEFGDCL